MWIEFIDTVRLGGRDCLPGQRRRLPAHVAMALCASGRAKKVDRDHAAPKPTDSAMRADDARERERTRRERGLREALVSALENGRKAALVEALEAVGFDPGEYANNAQRSEALRTWLEV